MKTHSEYLERTIQLAKENVEQGGWPFAATLVKDNVILAEAVNNVAQSHDPSDHAEIAAIRKATATLSSSDLSGTTMYVLAPPCPMCMTCMLFAQITETVYCVDVANKDAALSQLPPTEGLYQILQKGLDGPIDFKHMPGLTSRGVAVLSNWNDQQGES